VSEAGTAGRATGSVAGPGGPETFRVVVLASGNGSNLQAIIDKLHGRPAGAGAPHGAAAAPGAAADAAADRGAATTGAPVIEVALVVSDQPGAPALERAKQAGIATALCPLGAVAPRGAGGRDEQERALLDVVRRTAPDLVVLAGYMRIVAPEFVRAFPSRIINLHPALLPAFPGTTSISDALHHGVKITGVTVHFVDEGLDTGPIIAQEAVRVEEGDTPETLAARIHAVEHRLLPATVRLLAAGRVHPPLPGTRVVQVD
jgi:phosphoribosylglycinamide formyltransferase-1